MDYINEQPWAGYLGQSLVQLAFVLGCLSAIAYALSIFRDSTTTNTSWSSIGRVSFLGHTLSIFSIIGLLFYMMIQHWYQYQYVQAHVSDDLPMRYIFSAFWEGQEGSFLLWMFWHAILGCILIWRSKTWEASTLFFLSLVQVVIMSMILGVYVTDDIKIGSSPFLLLRDTIDAPIFATADYVGKLQGTGLNPLLQNYWMTIHPPTLFLGFASTVVPFCFALGGLITRRYTEWLRPALPWALFSGAILGLGILMGGAWAYEALSFGGYWAWDPVENMSLVPWLIMVAGIHTHLVANATGHSIKATVLFYVASFVMILYSTFLTRSGVLGDTSVHAFTEMGLENQLVLLVSSFLLIGLGLVAYHWRRIPAPQKEEGTPSKEFWMFIGSLVLLFSAGMMTASTSLPVYNKIREFFDPTFVGQVITDQIEHHNKFQLWIGVFMGLFSGFAQFLRWKEPNWSNHQITFLKHLAVSLGITTVLSFVTAYWIDVTSWQYASLLFFCWFTVVSNAEHFLLSTRKNMAMSASVLSHIGFGLMLIGSLASGLNKHYISSNPFAMEGLIEGASEEDLKKNIILMKNTPLKMNDYLVTYVKDTIQGVTRTFEVNYKRMGADGAVLEEFDLHPNILYAKDFSKIAASNPATKHYFGRDIFTHIPSLPIRDISIDSARAQEERIPYERYEFAQGDTVFTKGAYALITGIKMDAKHPEYTAQKGDMSVGLEMEFHDIEGDTVYKAFPVTVLREGFVYWFPDHVVDLKTKVRLHQDYFSRFFPEKEALPVKLRLKVGQSATVNDVEIKFSGFNKQPAHPQYKAEEGDIAVSASLTATKRDDVKTIEPLYLIRDSKPMNLLDQIVPWGLHVQFVGINPQEETAEIEVFYTQPDVIKIPVEIAENVSRNDWIVLEAIVFPGINIFWFGSLTMLLGLAIGMWHRRKQRSVAKAA